MFWLVVYLFMFLFLHADCQDKPDDFGCKRDRFKILGLYWDTFFMGTTGCEVIDHENNEKCAICGFKYGDSGENNVCNHLEFLWKFDFYKRQDGNKVQQLCKMTDHCKMSYAMEKAQNQQIKEGKNKTNFVNYICGTENRDGKREQKGRCRNAYGTYVCECEPPYQGRDCNDAGAPDGAYATGVQVLLDTKVRVSEPMPILIAVRYKGNDLKVHVNLFHLNNTGPTITVTQPTIKDRWSTRLIKYCKERFDKNEHMKEQCEIFLKGSSSIYSVTLRFPLERDDNRSLLYYNYKDESEIIPIGYYISFTVTTTNTIGGVEKVSFVRTNYDSSYSVFVQYPIEYMECYENPKIVNCKHLQQKVQNYNAASVTVVYGSNLKNYVHEENTPECRTNGDDTIKWTLFRVMPEGNFLNVYQFKTEREMEFFIKPYTFKNGIYLVEFSYSMLQKWDVEENFDRCFLQVVEAPIIAIIEGGSGRYVDVETFIILDGSGSYDPNVQKQKSKEGLSFRWSCSMKNTKSPCLVDHLPPSFGSNSYLKLPPNILEAHKEYTIELSVKQSGKNTASVSQTVFTGNDANVESVGIICINCMEGNVGNPTDYIYLFVKLVLKPNATIKTPLNFTWTFASHPVYQPDRSVDAIRVNHTSEDLLKIDKNKLEQNQTYRFRAATVQGKNFIFSDIDILVSAVENFTCSLTPDSGIAAVTNFALNCSESSLTFEVYDKSSSDPNYFSGRMLFTDLNSVDGFKLADKNLVVYGYNDYKVTHRWVHDVNLSPFNGSMKDIDEMVLSLNNKSRTVDQKLLHSASVISAALKSEMYWSSISLLKKLISLVYKTDFQAMQYTKLVLSSIEFILVVMTRNSTKILNVKEAKQCADMISALGEDLFARVKNFNNEKTLTETILHQMIRSVLNVIEIVLSKENADVWSKPLYLVNPHVVRSVKDTSNELVDALYKMSSCLLWRQIQGDSAKEIISAGSKITEWAIVHYPDVLYDMISSNRNIPFNFSHGLYEIMKNFEVLGIQVTDININPFWWAGGDINTNILLVDVCFKVNPTRCKYHRKFYTSPLFVYFNTSHVHSEIKPVEMHTVYLNLSKDMFALDMDITVYRFDPPLRAKLFIRFEFENSTENYKVIFSVNRRPDFELMQDRGITINNDNQSNVKYLNYLKDDSDKLYYMGIFPVHEGSAGKRVNFKLKISYAVCKTWLRLRWGSGSCWVGEQETNEGTLRCDCYHLSMFAGAVQVPPYRLNPALEFILFLTDEFNWLPLIVLVIIVLLFLLLYVWGWREDCKDSMRGLITILEDNYPGEMYAYLLGVYTGARIKSGTDANVGIRLFGVDFRSRAHILKSSDRKTLRRNTDDWFLLNSPAHLGTLEKINIWHDGSGKSPDWFVEKIEVYDLTEKMKYIFDLNVWLALEVKAYPEAVATAYSIDDFYSVKRVFLSNVRSGFRDNHYWTSIFWKHPRNPVKRVLRISVVLCYVMVAMTLTVIVYRFNKGEEYEEDEPNFELDHNDFFILIITLFVASFTSCLLMFLFRKSFSIRYMKMQSSLFLRPEIMSKRSHVYVALKQNDNTPQVDVSRNLENITYISLYDPDEPKFIKLSTDSLGDRYISFALFCKAPSEKSVYEKFAAAIHSIFRGSTLEPVRLAKYRKNVILHKQYLITAWTLFVVAFLGATVVFILFGHRLPKVEGLKWITVVLCVLLFDALILSTLKILLSSIILGCVFQRLVSAFNYQVKPEEGRIMHLFGDSDHLDKLTLIRSHPMYCPLHGKLKELNRQKCVRRERWKTLIDFVVVLMFILVLVILIFSITFSLYRSNAHAAWMLTKGASSNYQNFTNIYNRTTYSDFLLHNFVERLHRYLWYTQEDSLNDDDHMSKNSWTYDCTTRLLGNARIRQLRVILGECSDRSYFEDSVEYCSPPWSSAVEDTGTYGSFWHIGGIEDSRRKSSAWRYTDSARSNSSESYGSTLTSYPGGGFIEELGLGNDDIQFALSNLFSQNWLDHTTRAVFVELTLCNVNTGLFTQVVLVAEQMPTGEYLVAVKSESVTTGFSFDIWMLSFCVLLIFFLVRMCISINRKGIFVYFSSLINLFEGFLLTLGFLTLIFYIMHITSSSDYVQEFQRSGTDQFFNFPNLIFYIRRTRIMFSILFACVVIRMLISLRFGWIYFRFHHTFLLSIPWIAWLVLYFILCLAIARRLVGYLLNMFVFPYSNSLIIHYKMPYASESDGCYYKRLVIVMCFLSYVVISLFIASFAYYYKLAKLYYFLSTDSMNYFTFVKEVICIKSLRNK